MTIPIYVAYSERRNQLTKADAEVVSHLPAVGDLTHGGQFVVDSVSPFSPDIATFSRWEACDYDYYLVHESDASGDHDFANDFLERYLAVLKEPA